jgi:hypothetical protein
MSGTGREYAARGKTPWCSFAAHRRGQKTDVTLFGRQEMRWAAIIQT